MSVAASQPNPTRFKSRPLPLAGALLLFVIAAAASLYYLSGAKEPSSEIAAIAPAVTGAEVDAAMMQSPNFQILFSDGDRGLMVYEGYVYVVRLGDKLPNGRRMIGFQKRDGNWAAVTL
ncbi:hypothetical protein IB277_24155 [Ensifer sp. ENS07]|uniref:Uncharacterized protein n=1 Tax=Ensifer adhaerens TaxID=106592 RepID=A0A9Q9DBU7_ENSAD|nr:MULTISPECIES: hypothetical protein [Ensifer]MBD9557972.1 hypothetical protein [Ensifer sp. ENS03]MBD9597536.1 hypothetical protein [Ensifer sp. ENS05]MBD9628256.1 hypothetical protein [Ensifer sp. ENS06]MBD9639383.1 hypothetical protein [Ensifer sp. ENS07]MBW0369482.1 hypothetical protein [Ensifer adhaerens]